MITEGLTVACILTWIQQKFVQIVVGQVSSNGIQRTLTFFPGIEHGAVRVEGEPDADLGFKPAPHRYHILPLGWYIKRIIGARHGQN